MYLDYGSIKIDETKYKGKMDIDREMTMRDILELCDKINKPIIDKIATLLAARICPLKYFEICCSTL